MRAVVYTQTGDPDVLHLVDRPTPEPGPGEVRVAVRVSGVNPTDWKSRASGKMAFGEQVPNHDGAGVIEAVGIGVDTERVGQRVWLWEAAWKRANGTAQQRVVLPSRNAIELPDGASFDLGACLGIPVLTAHRCLTVGDGGPARLEHDVLSGQTVLIAGGAGAVGNAAIQLARWAGATVITTVSSVEKAELAACAGAQYVINYREEDAAVAIRALASNGVDIIVEVAPSANAQVDGQVLGLHGVIAAYADDADTDPVVPIARMRQLNARWQGVLTYTVPETAKDHAVTSVANAVAAGGFRVGVDAGLPLHYFPLEHTAEAHAAVQASVIGRVLITVP